VDLKRMKLDIAGGPEGPQHVRLLRSHI
jgi:hypothetical protein